MTVIVDLPIIILMVALVLAIVDWIRERPGGEGGGDP